MTEIEKLQIHERNLRVLELVHRDMLKTAEGPEHAEMEMAFIDALAWARVMCRESLETAYAGDALADFIEGKTKMLDALSEGPATRPMRPVGVVTSTGVLTDAVDLPAFPDEDGEVWLRRHVESAVTPTEPPVALGGVYRVEVGGATYWMKLDEPAHDHVMAALATVDDDSSPLDIGDIVALGDAELDRRHTDEDEEPYTLREIASMRPAPCVLGCSEWS